MTRAMSVVALVLALLIGVVLGHLTAVDSSGVTPTVSAGRTERVQRFYDGMNRYLASGDDAFLQFMAPEFRELSTVGDAEGSTETLLARLDTLRRSAVPPRFTVEEIHELGSLVEVRVSTGVPAAFDIAGLSAATALAPSVIEFVQLQGDAIVAHWSQSDWIPTIGQTLDTPVPLDAVHGFAFDLSQIVLDSGAELELPRAAAWLLVETGLIAADDGISRLRLEPGESRQMTGPGPARIHNPASGQAVVWLASVEEQGPDPASTYGQAPAPPSGVTVTHLAWAGQFDVVGASGLRVRMARATLPPGSQLTAAEPGAAGAIAVIAGELDATVQQGTAFHCRTDGTAATIRGAEAIPAGDGIATLPDASPSYRVSGSTPATLLVLTIQPSA